jgi:two-component system response regulator NreC
MQTEILAAGAAPLHPRILLIGDFADVRAGLRQLLELVDSRFEISEASFGEDAFDQIQKAQPDLLLVDLEAGARKVWNRSDSAGIAGLRDRLPQARIFALTVHDTPEVKETVVRAGADEIFVKGCDTEKMLAMLSCFQAR